MTTWEEAQARAMEEAGEVRSVRAPERPSADAPLLIVVDHFDLSMVDVHPSGARLLIRPVSRLDALQLVREYAGKVAVVALNERGQGLLERELQLEPAWRPKVSHGTRLLVVYVAKWNDIRWHLVTYESDGDGCIP